MKKLITVLALSLTATVCFAGPADSENASTVPVASVLKAQKAISILANNPSVQFQGGTVIHDLTKVDRTKPWCKMEMVNTVSNERTLKDESRLRISSLYSNYEYIQDEKKKLLLLQIREFYLS
jgi:hypothetical protein